MRAVAGLLLGLAILGAGCAAGPDTVVLVVVSGRVAQPIDHFQVEAAVGARSKQIRIPERGSPGPIFLPVSFTLQIPRDRVGTLRVSVDARDAGGRSLARGTGELPALTVGRRQELEILLEGGEPAPGVPDAGPPDAAPDAPAPAPDARDAALDAPEPPVPDAGPEDVAEDVAAPDAPPADAGADRAPARDAGADAAAERPLDVRAEAAVSG